MNYDIRLSLVFCTLLFCAASTFGQNIGIGTPTPDYTLDINGSLGINDTLFHNGDPDTWVGFPASDTWEMVMGSKRVAVTQLNEFRINPSQSGVDLLVNGDGINTLLRTDVANDAVGIGTGTPAHLVDIQGDMRISGDGINALVYADPTTNRVGIGTGTPAHLVDIQGDMRITGDGINALMYADPLNSRLGIGTPNPSYLVDIQGGDVRITGDGINALLFVDYDQRRVGIGTDTPQSDLDVAGEIRAESVVVGNTGSSIGNIQHGEFIYTPDGTNLQFITVTYNALFANTPKIFFNVYNPIAVSIETYTTGIYSTSNTETTFLVREADMGTMNDPLVIRWFAIE